MPRDSEGAQAECVFCRIVAGDHPAETVYEDEDTLAFLDQRPVFHGHCLVVPRRHVETLDDLPDELIQPVFSTARLISRAVREALDAGGTFVAMNNRISQSVPHLHVHVVPRRKKDGLRGFFWPRHPYEDDERVAEYAKRIRAAVEAMQG